NLDGDQVSLDSIGVDTVVDLGKGAVEIPGKGETAVFVFLKALEFFDEVDFELYRHPRGKLEGDIDVDVSTAVTPSFGSYTHGSRLLNPLFRSKREAIQTSLFLNPVEFHGIKLGVVKLFPDAKEFQCIAIAEPVTNEIVGVVGVCRLCDVCERNVIL
ncbi:MAG: hypothetical protein WCY01_11095, partial [Alkalispirochaeta sp.]